MELEADGTIAALIAAAAAGVDQVGGYYSICSRVAQTSTWSSDSRPRDLRPRSAAGDVAGSSTSSVVHGGGVESACVCLGARGALLPVSTVPC